MKVISFCIRKFRKHKISDSHFIPTTGYGYDDIWRDSLEKVYADVFERKLDLFVRKLFQVLTPISTALFGILRPGDELLYITGKPYDTLEEIVGVRGKV